MTPHTETLTVRGFLTVAMREAQLRAQGLIPPYSVWAVARKPKDPHAPFRVTTFTPEVPRS